MRNIVSIDEVWEEGTTRVEICVEAGDTPALVLAFIALFDSVADGDPLVRAAWNTAIKLRDEVVEFEIRKIRKRTICYPEGLGDER